MSATAIPLGQGMTVRWSDQGDGWPGEPDRDAPTHEVCLGCGIAHPVSDIYEVRSGVWRCVTCWVRSRHPNGVCQEARHA